MDGMVIDGCTAVVRQLPSDNGKVVAGLETFDDVEVIDRRGEWSRIRRDSIHGWIKTKCLVFIRED